MATTIITGIGSDLFLYAHIDHTAIRAQVAAATTDTVAVELLGSGTAAYTGVVQRAGGLRSYVAGLARKAKRDGFRHLCLTGWSAGGALCQDGLIAGYAEGYLPDAVVLLDAVYGSKPSGSKRGDGKVAWSARLEALTKYAIEAARGEKILVMLYSGIATEYASTSECVRAVVKRVEAAMGVEIQPDTSLSAADLDGHGFSGAWAMGSLHVVSFSSATASEHIKEAHLFDQAWLRWVPWSRDDDAPVPRMPSAPDPTAKPVIPAAAPTPYTAAPIRTMRLGHKGDDVAALQRDLTLLGYVLGAADGDFGPRTLAAVLAFQRTKGLTADGLVGSATRAAIAAALRVTVPDVDVERDTEPAPAVVPTGKIAFVQARNYTRANRTKIDLIVVHSMEAAEASTTAENVARWFAGPNAPRASAHFCIDNDSIVQCVRDEDVAWHAPGANHNGIGLEHAGYARQTAAEWRDEYSATMLRRSASLAAALCAKYAIPIRFVDAAGLLRGERGITTHAAVSKAFKQSTHTDPGVGFEMDAYLEMIRHA